MTTSSLISRVLFFSCACTLVGSVSADKKTTEMQRVVKYFANEKDKPCTFTTEQKEAFLKEIKQNAPETIKEKALTYGPSVVGALAELYAVNFMDTTCPEQVQKNIAVSSLACALLEANHLMNKNSDMAQKAAGTLVNGYFLLKNYEKYENLDALVARNAAESEKFADMKNKLMAANVAATALILFGEHGLIKAANEFKIESSELSKETFDKHQSAKRFGFLTSLLGQFVSVGAQAYRYKLELEGLEEYKKETSVVAEESAPAAEQEAAPTKEIVATAAEEVVERTQEVEESEQDIAEPAA